MSLEKENSSGSSKAHKRYVYLNKFTDYRDNTDRKFNIVENNMRETKRKIRTLTIWATVLTIILLAQLAIQLTT